MNVKKNMKMLKDSVYSNVLIYKLEMKVITNVNVLTDMKIGIMMEIAN